MCSGVLKKKRARLLSYIRRNDPPTRTATLSCFVDFFYVNPSRLPTCVRLFLPVQKMEVTFLVNLYSQLFCLLAALNGYADCSGGTSTMIIMIIIIINTTTTVSRQKRGGRSQQYLTQHNTTCRPPSLSLE